MNKTKVFSLVGFLGAVGTATALIGSASGATGAYFSSTSNHTLSSSTGHLTLNTDNPTLNFSNLVPGVYSSLPVDYNVDSSTPVDLWLQFPTEQTYDPFTGAKNSTYAPNGGLGGYGHFAVTDTHSGQVFISNNLENQPAGDTSTTDTCAVNSNGDGGSDAASLDSSNPVPYCGYPSRSCWPPTSHPAPPARCRSVSASLASGPPRTSPWATSPSTWSPPRPVSLRLLPSKSLAPQLRPVWDGGPPSHAGVSVIR